MLPLIVQVPSEVEADCWQAVKANAIIATAATFFNGLFISFNF
jgi:hypothetical protein